MAMSQAYVSLALALEKMNLFDEARVALDEAIRHNPDLPIVYEHRARLHLARKQWAAAREDFVQAIARESKDQPSDRLVQNLVELGRLHLRQDKAIDALACLDRAAALQPRFLLTQRFRAEALLALDRPAEAGVALDQYLAGATDAPTEVYQARGLIFAASKQLPGAIAMYTLALQRNPADMQTRCYRGWTYLLTDAVRLALEDFETCLRADATNADALAGRGNARIRLRELDGALADARSAEAQGPVTDRLLYNLTRIYAQAAGQLAMQARSGSKRPPTWQADLYREKAFDYLARTLEKLRPGRRTAFWRDQVEADPALAGIRGGRQYYELAVRYGGKGT
jgi:tetratricopeptide (TPR) repeat protein